MKQGKSRFVFPGGNLPAGFHSFYRSGLQRLDNVFILKGGPGTGKSTLMRKIGLAMMERGYDVEFWQCSSDNDSLDGVVIPALSVAVIDGTAPHTVDPIYPGVVEEIINLGDHWNTALLKAHKKEVMDCGKEINECFKEAYKHLEQAAKQDKARKELYAGHESVEEMAKVRSRLCQEIFHNKGAGSRHLFARAVSPVGLQSFILSLSRDCLRRYFLSGPDCTAKNELMLELLAEAEAAGRQAEVFHSPYDLEFIEMLLLPAQKIAVIACEEDELPEPGEGDVLIDLAVDCGEDSALREQVVSLRNSREEQTDAAAAKIAEAKRIHDRLESFYSKAMDFDAVDLTSGKLFNRILAIAAEKLK